MFHAALVALKPTRAQQHVIGYAIALAARCGWELEGLSVIDEDQWCSAEPVPLGAGAYKAHRDAARMAEARNNALEDMAALEAACEVANVQCSTRIHEGKVVDMTSHAAYGCDVLMCGHAAGGDTSTGSLLHALLRQTPRPAIVVPQHPVNGEHVLAAYDGSPQAARALASFAGSGMGAGKTIHVASWHASLETAAALGELAARFLRRHGCLVEVHADKLTQSPAEHLLEGAARVNAGMIVMGSYGKSGVYEFFFGSVTKAILQAMPAVVYLDR